MGANFFNKFMSAIGVKNNDDDEYIDDEVDYDIDEEQYDDYNEQTRARRNFRDIEESNSYGRENVQSKVIPVNTAVSSSQMVITQPSSFNEIEEIGDYLKQRKSVIINLENVTKEDARRIIDFLSGATFMMDGTFQGVSNLIYLITPRNIEIQNDVERSKYKQQKMSFSWLK